MESTLREKQWMAMYHLAEDFFRQNGHLLVPGNYKPGGQPLGPWIGTQRWDYKHRGNSRFTRTREELLNAIGMAWDAKEAGWEIMYGCCREYLREHGNIRIPQSYVTVDGRKLGIWMNRQRMDRKSNRLSPEKIRRLEELPMVWQPGKLRRSQWDQNLELLLKYQEVYGNILVPSEFIDPSGVRLGQWLSNQRNKYLSGVLSKDRTARLETMGVLWVVKEGQWSAMHERARNFYLTNGHLNSYANRDNRMDASLRSWLVRQRSLYRLGHLPENRILALNEIGICWEVSEEQWKANYEKAKEYYSRYGSLSVPKDKGTPELRRLGQWISTQRKVYRETGGHLKDDRAEKLEAVGMVWDASVDSKAVWDGWYCRAEIFYREYGHLEPPDGELKTWVQAQKYKKKGKRGGLTDEQIKRLESIDIIWDVNDSQWMQMYRLAREYYDIHEKLNIPANYTAMGGERLGIWICHQRSAYKNLRLGLRGGGRSQITSQQVAMLNGIEMVWDASVLSTRTSFQERAIHYYLKKDYPDVCKLSQWDFLGCEIDVYIPSLKTGIEYDGYLHAKRVEQDEKKNRICRESGIRLIRVREPGLPVLKGSHTEIHLIDLSDTAFEDGLCRLFAVIGGVTPKPDIVHDRPLIYAGYKDYVTYRWDSVYEQLFEYYQKFHGLPCAPNIKSREGTGFVSWMNVQRKAYGANELTERQIHKMEKLDMIWTPMQDRWDYMYGLAEAYYRDQGDLNIPVAYKTPSGDGLGKWLSAQRGRRLDGTLSARRIHRLEKLGIVWSFFGQKRKAAMAAAKDYYRCYGNLDIPPAYITGAGVRLGEWLGQMRNRRRLGSLNTKTAAELEAMGVKWEPFTDRWEEMYQAALHYHSCYGNIWIPPDYVTPNGQLLGGWISKQRAKYHGKGKGSPLTTRQLEKLNELGMVWDPYMVKWMVKYREAELFFEAYGHLKVPVEYVAENGTKLGMWLSSQRQAMRGNPNFVMTEERKCLLDAIGMDWTLKRTKPGAKQRGKCVPYMGCLYDT